MAAWTHPHQDRRPTAAHAIRATTDKRTLARRPPIPNTLWLGQGAGALGFEARHIDLLHQHGRHLGAGLRHVGVPRVAAARHLALDVLVHVQRALKAARVNAVPARVTCMESASRSCHDRPLRPRSLIQCHPYTSVFA